MLGRLALTVAAISFVIAGPAALIYIWMLVDIRVCHGLGLITMYSVLTLIIIIANELTKAKQSPMQQTKIAPKDYAHEQVERNRKQSSGLR